MVGDNDIAGGDRDGSEDDDDDDDGDIKTFYCFQLSTLHLPLQLS